MLRNLLVVTAQSSGIGVGHAHHIAVLGDVGEPAQGFDVAGTHQGSLSLHG